jgi:hypothetical protein
VRVYPDVPRRRAATVASDLLVVCLLLLFAWAGKAVHDTVDSLAVLGEGVRSTGESVQSRFESAAEAVDGVPLVGDSLAEGLRTAGGGTGGNVAELGQRGEDSVHDLANLLGLITFLLPAAVLLARAVPQRVAQVRRLNAAAVVLDQPDSPERRRVTAMRAAFGLPYGTLLEYTTDPLGDLVAERYDALVAAALDDAGLRRPVPAAALTP